MSLKGSVTVTSVPTVVKPEFDAPYEDPIAKFGPGEYYAHESEFFGKKAPALTLEELSHDRLIQVRKTWCICVWSHAECACLIPRKTILLNYVYVHVCMYSCMCVHA
jgi:hypothetical protein